MSKYKIEIEEILQKVVEVEADSIEDAMCKVSNEYNECNITLNGEDLKEINIRKFN